MREKKFGAAKTRIIVRTAASCFKNASPSRSPAKGGSNPRFCTRFTASSPGMRMKKSNTPAAKRKVPTSASNTDAMPNVLIRNAASMGEAKDTAEPEMD